MRSAGANIETPWSTVDYLSRWLRNQDVHSKICWLILDLLIRLPASTITVAYAQLLVREPWPVFYALLLLHFSFTHCTYRNTSYKITFELDNWSEIYWGETYRPLNCRFDEHCRSAANLTAKSYIDKPLAKHNRGKHLNHSGLPKLKLEIMDKGDSLIDRQTKEARFLVQNKASLND